jgi:hypothetical protein
MFSAPFLSTLLHRMRAVVRRVARPGAERARVLPAKGTGDTGHRSPVLRELARAWLSAQLAALTLLTMRIEAGETPDAAGHAPASASDDGNGVTPSGSGGCGALSRSCGRTARCSWRG